MILIGCTLWSSMIDKKWSNLREQCWNLDNSYRTPFLEHSDRWKFSSPLSCWQTQPKMSFIVTSNSWWLDKVEAIMEAHVTGHYHLNSSWPAEGLCWQQIQNQCHLKKRLRWLYETIFLSKRVPDIFMHRKQAIVSVSTWNNCVLVVSRFLKL